MTTQHDEAVERLREALESAQPYVIWFRDKHCKAGDASWGDADELDREIDAALSATAAGKEAANLAWFSGHRRLSLNFYSPVYGDDDDQSEEWRVSKESGPINDREWDIVGRGATAAQAIAAARAALANDTEAR